MEIDLSQYLTKTEGIETTECFVPYPETLRSKLVSDNYNIAIIGVESESDEFNIGAKDAPNTIRKHLYELSGTFERISIADLGNLKLGRSKEDVYFALKDVVGYLLHRHVVPIVIGGTQELTVAMNDALEEYCKHKRICIVDSKIDLKESVRTVTANNFISRLFNNTLSSLSVLGYQNYYCSKWQLEEMGRHEAVCVRLRDMTNAMIDIEPFLRDCELFSFDMSSVRQSDSKGHALCIPNGLNGVQACQIAQYAGLSDSMMVYGLFGYNPIFDDSGASAALSAQIIWHILYGIDNRYEDYPLKTLNSYENYAVRMDGDGERIDFYYNKLNGRWWILIPSADGSEHVYACSLSDYKAFCNNSIPDIWMRHFRK